MHALQVARPFRTAGSVYGEKIDGGGQAQKFTPLSEGGGWCGLVPVLGEAT